MIGIDIPLPGFCEECPCSHTIREGVNAGEMICEALEFRDKPKNNVTCLVDVSAKYRPVNCPIKIHEMTLQLNWRAYEEI